MDDQCTPRRPPGDDDFRIAELVLRRTTGAELNHGTFSIHKQKLAEYRAAIGGDRFALLYKLRPPRDLAERLTLKCYDGEITPDEFRTQLKADAERPLDAETLARFCNEHGEQLALYSSFLQLIVEIATDQRDRNAWRRREPEIDAIVLKLRAPWPILKEHVRSAHGFMTEVRATRDLGPLHCKTFAAPTAHLLIEQVVDRACEAWKESKDTAERSRNDPAYSYSTNATSLFYKVRFSGLPRPNELMALLELERQMMLKEFAARSVENSAPTSGNKSKTRMKREVAEPLIAAHLQSRPHDTAKETAHAVGCSIGVVAESSAWKLNQERLSKAKIQGTDPIAVKLDERSINELGGSTSRMPHDHRRAIEATNADLDEKEGELFKLIGEYENAHPGASREEIMAKTGCSAGDIERRNAILNRLAKEQQESKSEDEDTDDELTKRGKRRKWNSKKP